MIVAGSSNLITAPGLITSDSHNCINCKSCFLPSKNLDHRRYHPFPTLHSRIDGIITIVMVNWVWYLTCNIYKYILRNLQRYTNLSHCLTNLCSGLHLFTWISWVVWLRMHRAPIKVQTIMCLYHLSNRQSLHRPTIVIRLFSEQIYLMY